MCCVSSFPETKKVINKNRWTACMGNPILRRSPRRTHFDALQTFSKDDTLFIYFKYILKNNSSAQALKKNEKNNSIIYFSQLWEKKHFQVRTFHNFVLYMYFFFWGGRTRPFSCFCTPIWACGAYRRWTRPWNKKNCFFGEILRNIFSMLRKLI